MSVSTLHDRSESPGLLRRRVGAALTLLTALAVFGGVWGYCFEHFSFAAAMLTGWIAAPLTSLVAGSAFMLMWTLAVERRRQGAPSR